MSKASQLGLSTAFQNYGDVGWRGARIARREERAYREYVSDEQRREGGMHRQPNVAVILKRSAKARPIQEISRRDAGSKSSIGLPSGSSN